MASPTGRWWPRRELRGRAKDEPHPLDAEPGDHPKAPYRNEHEFATMIGMMVAQKLGVSWSDYEKTVLSLGPRPKRMLVRPELRESI